MFLPIVKRTVVNGKERVTLDLTWPLVGICLFLSALKLAFFPSWSWIAVWAPLWVFPALIIGIFAIGLGVFLFLWAYYAASGQPKPKWKVKWTNPLTRGK